MFNDTASPPELEIFLYRKMFNLSALEMEAEPIDQFYTNLYIRDLIQKKQEKVDKHG